jgi:hypothetical protein
MNADRRLEIMMKKLVNQSKSKLTFFEKILLVSASDSACFLAIILLVSTILFILKIPITIYNLPISFVLSIIFNIWFSKKVKADFFIQSIAKSIMLIFFLVSIFVSSSVYDLSYDGQAYQQEAVVLLNHGWNPFYMTLVDEATANLERWLNHYPKGNWIIAANIYKLTRNIESGKVLSIFSGFIGFSFVLLGCYKLKINFYLKLLISALFVLNPVFLYQSLSYYIDGVLVSLLVSLAFISFRIVKQRENFLFWPFLFVSIILVNIKLSAVVFFGVLAFAFFLYLLINDQLKLSFWFAKLTIVSVLIGILFVGFNPYITNFSAKGHPLYPAMGEDAYNYVETNIPENYWSLKPPTRLLASIFSESSLAKGKGKFGVLKLPITISQSELESFRQTNIKVGGFGALFGLAFLLSVFGFIYYQFNRLHIQEKLVSLSVITLIFAFAAIIPTSSVARYVPFVWWIPCVIVLLLFTKKTITMNVIGSLVIITVIINNLMVGAYYYPYNLKKSVQLDKQLNDLSHTISSPLHVNFGQFGSTKVKLNKYNIPYNEVFTDDECKDGKIFLVSNISKICEPLIKSP